MSAHRSSRRRSQGVTHRRLRRRSLFSPRAGSAPRVRIAVLRARGALGSASRARRVNGFPRLPASGVGWLRRPLGGARPSSRLCVLRAAAAFASPLAALARVRLAARVLFPLAALASGAFAPATRRGVGVAACGPLVPPPRSARAASCAPAAVAPSRRRAGTWRRPSLALGPVIARPSRSAPLASRRSCPLARVSPCVPVCPCGACVRVARGRRARGSRVARVALFAAVPWPARARTPRRSRRRVRVCLFARTVRASSSRGRRPLRFPPRASPWTPARSRTRVASRFSRARARRLRPGRPSSRRSRRSHPCHRVALDRPTDRSRFVHFSARLRVCASFRLSG